MPTGTAHTLNVNAERLLSVSGSVEWLDDEDFMDAGTALSGSGPGYLFYVVECLAKAGERAGLPGDTAARLARQTVIGAGASLAQSPKSAVGSRLRVEQRRRGLQSSRIKKGWPLSSRKPLPPLPLARASWRAKGCAAHLTVRTRHKATGHDVCGLTPLSFMPAGGTTRCLAPCIEDGLPALRQDCLPIPSPVHQSRQRACL